MTVAFMRKEGQAQWIQRHANPKEPKKFECFGDKYTYYLVEDPDPDMPIWIGYNEHAKAFFVSNSATQRIRLHALRMECGRRFYADDKNHLSAVKKALEIKGKFRKDVIKFLFTFYQGYAVQLTELNEDEMEDDLTDIVDTAEYLETLQG